MMWQPQRWTPAQLEERRLAAGRLLRAGRLSQAALARRLGVSRAAVTQWKHRLHRAGWRGLHRGRPSGRPSRLRAGQWHQLLRLLRRGAQQAGFATERWTLPRIARVVEREFGVSYHPSSLGRALRARGWSPQVPIAQAKERDEALVAAWLTRDWPRVKRGLAEAGERLPSWTRQVTRFGPTSAPLGRPSAIPPC
jgi:putative transposase